MSRDGAIETDPTWTQGLASLEKTPEIVFEDLDLKTAILLPQYNTFRKVGKLGKLRHLL